jgi:hypothetical protein
MVCLQDAGGGEGLQIMEGSCENIFYAIMDSWQRVLLQRAVGLAPTTPHPNKQKRKKQRKKNKKKACMLQNVTQDLGLGRNL